MLQYILIASHCDSTKIFNPTNRSIERVMWLKNLEEPILSQPGYSRKDHLSWNFTRAFPGHVPPINCRRTLDRCQNPSIHDIRAQDDDFVLYKLTKEHLHVGMSTITAGNEENDELPREDDVFNGNLLIVEEADDIVSGYNYEVEAIMELTPVAETEEGMCHRRSTCLSI
jgi:hypothetical protein